DIPSQQKPVLGSLLKCREVPIRLKLVGWLMVMLAVVLLVGALAELGRLPSEYRGMPDSECRHAHMRESEMVGPEVVAGLRLGVRRDLQVEAPSRLLGKRPYRGAVGAGQYHVARASPRIERVVVQVDGSLRQRRQRVSGVIFRALEYAFLGGDGQKQCRA